MTQNCQCPVCSMRLYSTACPRCGAQYQGGKWITRQPAQPKPQIAPDLSHSGKVA
jgi:hypothetical protein